MDTDGCIVGGGLGSFCQTQGTDLARLCRNRTWALQWSSANLSVVEGQSLNVSMISFSGRHADNRCSGGREGGKEKHFVVQTEAV